MSPRKTRTFWLQKVIFAAALVCAWLSAPRAEYGLGPVGIVNDNEPDPRAQSVRQRLGSELLAAQMTWVMIEPLQDLAQTPGGPPWALVFIVTSERGVAVDIALPARGAAGATARRLIPVGGSSALTPTELALRTVEVLRAHVAAGPVEHFQASKTPVPAQDVPPPPRAKLQFDIGASAMRGRGGLSVGVGPAATAALVGPHRWGGRLAFTSSVLGGNANGADVVAEVSQMVLTVEALWFARGREAALRPYLLLGAGGFFLHAKTKADERLLAKSASRWAAAGVAGVGVSVALGSQNVRLVAEAKALVAAPALSIEVVGPVAGVAGKPTAVGTLAVSWML